ncbi:hypothetical protein ACMT1E_05080 [Sphingomonas flavalba]|uniref:hypothetical protein n=1 Tax=Sphingomonas flavalba TaxID=2559804 RepID=UPI0039E17F23
MTHLFRTLFWLAVAVTLYFAWSPQPPQILPGDKYQHALAFAALATIATLGWPSIRWWVTAALLAAFGGLIELVQAIPAIHRDADVHDWYADMAAVAVALLLSHLLLRLLRRRDRES